MDRRKRARKPGENVPPGPRPQRPQMDLATAGRPRESGRRQAPGGPCPQNRPPAAQISPRPPGPTPEIPPSPIPTMDSQRLGAAFSRKTGSANAMQRILILGGTAEARQLAQKLASRDNFAVTLS